jgi:hypothetical protein
MSTNQEAQTKLETAIGVLADRAAEHAEAGAPTGARDLAEGAKELAEAHAWLRSSAQPH